jgi:hypothetical protein
MQTKTLSTEYSVRFKIIYSLRAPLNFIYVQDFVAFKANFVQKQAVFDKLKKLVDTQSMVAITLESWREIERLWSKLETQVKTSKSIIFQHK